MIRQNLDGRSIYYDSIWKTIKKIGEKLIKLGFKESNQKPNLFFNVLKKNENYEQNQVYYADLRGTQIVPIWEDPRPLVYGSKVEISDFMKQTIILKRNGCKPRGSFYDMFEPEGWGFLLNDGIPNGYCTQCGKDIVDTTNWALLGENAFEFFEKGIVVAFEIYFCETCREMEYAKKEYRAKYFEIINQCEICNGKKDLVNHHITYVPEKIIGVCRSCHGKIHGKKFPNPLWKQQKKNVKKIIKKKKIQLEDYIC